MKTNKEILDLFDQMSGAKIEKLIWIAADPENRDIADMMVDIVDGDSLKGVFPDIPNGDALDYEEEDDLRQLLIEYRKFGFLAQVFLPRLDNFSFNEQDKPRSWAMHQGCGYLAYAYAETTEELVRKIKAIADDHFNNSVKDFRSKAHEKDQIDD